MDKNKDQVIQVRMSPVEVLILNQAVADSIANTGMMFTRSDVIRIALEEYAQKQSEMRNK